MDPRLKRRLLIAIIIVALVVIFLPIPFSHIAKKADDQPVQNIPPAPMATQNEASNNMPNMPVAPSNTVTVTPLDTTPVNTQPTTQSVVSNVAVANNAQAPVPTIQNETNMTAPETLVPLHQSKPVATKKTITSVYESHIHHASKATVVSEKGDWAVQLGSFPEEKISAQLVRKLKEAGYPAEVHAVIVNGKTMYRVYAGPYLHEETAKEKQVEIANKLNMIGFVHEITK